jgi:lysophospholipase L1-like esterase
MTTERACLAVCLLVAGCGGGSEAARRPSRLVVLGDSIAACFNVGGKDGPACSPRMLADHLRTTYAPVLVYENRAVNGAITTDVPARQLATVEGGPGHVLVLVYVGGNDLARRLLATDAAASSSLTRALPAVNDAWEAIVAHFSDRTRFPDGYTLVMNTQYDPFDDCTAPPCCLSPGTIQRLHTFNETLASIATRHDAKLVDQFTPFLGHGHHFAVATCPHYQPGATPWMGDLIHPNPAGHAALFDRWKELADDLYR